MASGLCKMVIIGNLGRDPEMRYTDSGRAVTSFSVASTRKWKNADGTDGTETTWVRLSAWGRLAEVCSEYLKKGRQVYVEARPTVDANGNPRTFQRQDGSTGASYEATVQEIKFLGSNGQEQSETAETTEEIPF